MSTWQHVELRCTGCSHPFETPVLKGIHITRLPEVKEAIRDGSFQRLDCPSCGLKLQVESSTVYTDFELQHYVALEPPYPSDWRGDLATHLEVFDRCFTFGPPIAEELSVGMRQRLVFGVRALREKVLAWDAGLDDRVLEALKGQWLLKQGKGLRDEELRLSSVLPGGHLLLVRLTESGQEGAPPVLAGHLTIPRNDYERALSGKVEEFPWLRQDWVVDLYVAAPC